MHVVGRHRSWPHDAVFVVLLLHDRGHRASGTDPVAAHDQRLLLAVFVKERCPERLAVLSSELEDVADLDCRLELKRPSAVRASVSLTHFTDVRKAGLEVSPRLDAA